MAKVVRRRMRRAWGRVAGMAALSAVALPVWSADGAAASSARPSSATSVAVAVARIAPLSVAGSSGGSAVMQPGGTVQGATAFAGPSTTLPAGASSATTSPTSSIAASTMATVTDLDTATGAAPAIVATVPIPPASAEAAPASVPSSGWLSLRPRLSMRLPLSAQDWRSASAAETRNKLVAMPDIQLVELPREPSVIGPPPKRAHHAISVGMEAPKQFLRSMGLDATECATRFRLPSKLGKSQNGDTTVEVSAHLGLGCKF